MQNKLRQLIVSALKRNEFTCQLPLDIAVKGYRVVVSGEVQSEFLVSEVVATVESVSPYLTVQPRLTLTAGTPVTNEAVLTAALN